MFRIENGRKAFYQWDINQRLIVDNAECVEVHFSNALSSTAYVLEVYEENNNRLVNVPNVLLQGGFDLKVYGYCGECVRETATFDVISREKPNDYVYTETEVKRYEDLEKRISNLEQGGGVDVDMTNYYTKAETDAAIGEATKEGVWELIDSMKVNDEGLTQVIRTAHIDGTQYNLSAAKVIARFYYPINETLSTAVYFKNDTRMIGGLVQAVSQQSGTNPIHKTTCIYQALPKAGIYEFLSANGQQGSGMDIFYPSNGDYQAVSTEQKINTILFAMWQGVIPVGTEIEIWGCVPNA